MPSPPSAIRSFTVDPPLAQSAQYRFDQNDRAYLDDAVRALEQYALDLSIAGTIGTWYNLDGASAACNPGDVVVLAGNAAGTVTRVTSGTLAAAGGMVFGVTLVTANPGTKIKVAISGVVPPSITGLPSQGGSTPYVRVNPATARCQELAALAGTDSSVGVVDTAGFLVMNPLGQSGSVGTLAGDAVGFPGSNVVQQLTGNSGSVVVVSGTKFTGQASIAGAGNNIEFDPQVSTGAASGSFGASVAAPGAGTTEAGLYLKRAGAFVSQTQTYPGSPTLACVYLGAIVPGAGNFALLSDGATETFVNAPSGGTGILTVNASAIMQWTSTGVAFGQPVGGSPSGFLWASSASIPLGASGVTTVSVAQSKTPALTVTSTTQSADVTLDFSTNGTSGYWIINVVGLQLNTHNFIIKNGTSTVTLAAAQLPATKTLVSVRTDGANTLGVA